MCTRLSLIPQLLVFLFVSRLGFSQSVIVVDASQGPGTDFPDIPAAVAAASNGDVLLIREGSYSNLIIGGKSLTVIGEGPALPLVHGASVRNLGVGQEVLIMGLSISSVTEAGLQIKNNFGTVSVEDCQAIGAKGNHVSSSTLNGHPGVQVANSQAVSLTNCTIIGGRGADYSTVAIITIGNGAEGCSVTGSSDVSLFGCNLTGGRGGNSEFDEAEWGGFGGTAAHCTTSTLSAVGSTFTGGNGGNGGDDDGGIFGGPTCGSGGNGGNGISALDSFQSSGNSVRLADNVMNPGSPGFGGLGCPSGLPGIQLHMSPGQPVDLGNQHISLDFNSPLPEGSPIEVEVHAEPGTVLFLGVSPFRDFQFFSSLHGVALIDLGTTQIFPLGTAGLSGLVQLTFPNAINLPAGTALSITGQIAGAAPGTTSIGLGEPASLILLDI